MILLYSSCFPVSGANLQSFFLLCHLESGSKERCLTFR